MPSIELGKTPEQSARAAEALTAFLTADSGFRRGPVATDAVRRGEKLFHEVGCSVCHGDQRVPSKERPEYAVPLVGITDKYSVNSLTEFLLNPHEVRPAGRMPSLHLSDEEARDVASFLIREVDVEPNIRFEYFEGDWQNLPDFSTLTPVLKGGTTEFSARISDRTNQFAVRFSGYLQIEEAGEYEFWLSSDDGSRLLIDDREIVNYDGVHPAGTEHAKLRLEQGAHPLVVEYFEFQGEEVLRVEIAGPRVRRQPLSGWITPTREKPVKSDSESVHTPEMVAEGQRLFSSLGCAACHVHGRGDNRLTWTGSAPKFSAMTSVEGCLGTDAEAVPRFSLNQQQRSDLRQAIEAAVKRAAPELSNAEQIDFAFTALNCYACHERNQKGGATPETNSAFVGVIPEMGDEARLPPHLTGVGDKLNPDWLKTILNEGARDRPYMLVRMPKFGQTGVGDLASVISTTDIQPETLDVEMPVAEHRYKADARHMIGDRALGCIKCHTFDQYKVTGVQAVNMTTMTRRLRREWFHRYLRNPSEYRPGTRMPGAWPNGRSVLPKILEGKPDVQIEAMWRYLLDGNEAKVPSGLQKQAIELKPVDRVLMYRNFLQGLSPRGIAVGFPEKAHYAWDAEDFAPRLIWHGAFIDASMHWEGRGPGAQSPLGDHVMTLPPGPSVAALNDQQSPWPGESPRRNGYQFEGYSLDEKGTPTFRYRTGLWEVTDHLQAVPMSSDAGFERTLVIAPRRGTMPSSAEDLLCVRIALGQQIENSNEEWIVDKSVRIRIREGTPLLRTSGDQKELLVLMPNKVAGDPQPSSNPVRVRYEMEW